MSSITLRDYQQRLIESVRAEFATGARRVLMVAPTGAGKTVMFSYITAGALTKGRHVVLLAHRQELIDQISATLRQFRVAHGFIAAGYPIQPRCGAQVASVQTLIRRLDRVREPDLLIIDEAHHATARNTLGRIVAQWSAARVLGVTATPERLSGEGMDEVFQRMIVGPSVADLIADGRLAPFRLFAPPTVDTSRLHLRAGDYITAEAEALVDKPRVTGDALEHYQRHAAGKRAIVYCVSVRHAQHVARDFMLAGISAMSIDGNMDRMQRRDAIERFKRGNIHVLTSCDLVSEGFDLPAIECGIFLRPTASLVLWLQQVGRCLRPWPGKQHAILLDHAGNALRHGLPDEPREWTLAGRERSTGRDADRAPQGVRVCPQCFSADRGGVPVCRQCGHVFAAKPRTVEHVDGQLQEITSRAQARREQGHARSLEALIEIGKMRRYKNPHAWAQHVLRGRAAKGKVA